MQDSVQPLQRTTRNSTSRVVAPPLNTRPVSDESIFQIQFTTYQFSHEWRYVSEMVGDGADRGNSKKSAEARRDSQVQQHRTHKDANRLSWRCWYGWWARTLVQEGTHTFENASFCLREKTPEKNVEFIRQQRKCNAFDPGIFVAEWWSLGPLAQTKVQTVRLRRPPTRSAERKEQEKPDNKWI